MNNNAQPSFVRGSARPARATLVSSCLQRRANHSSAPLTQRTFRLMSSEDELHLHSLLGMVVNQIESSLSLFRTKGLRDHGLRLHRAALEPLNDLREEMSVEPGADKGQLLFDDLLLTDIAGCRREAEETNAAGRACDPASLLQKRSHPCPINDHRGTEPIHLSPRDVHHWHALRVDRDIRTEGPGSLQARLVRIADQTACPLQLCPL